METEGKTGILLAASGTTCAEARVALENVERVAARRFARREIRWAFASDVIRQKLAARGTTTESPVSALSRMRGDGFTRVAVQPIQVVGGMEHERLRDVAARFRYGPDAFAGIAVGRPLMGSGADLVRVLKAVLAEVPPARSASDAVILVGHGSEGHSADLAYLAAESACHGLDDRAFLGCVVGRPGLAEVVRRCRESGVKKAYLMPFTVTAGSSVRRAIASEGGDSWRSTLAAEGIDGVPVLRGLGEYDRVVDVWMDHLEAAVSETEAAAPPARSV